MQRATQQTPFQRPRRKKLLFLCTTAVMMLSIALGTAAFLTVNHSETAHAQQTPNMNCTLIVPAHPLTAQGLATPYQLVATDPAMGPCNEANPAQSAFVQG